MLSTAVDSRCGDEVILSGAARRWGIGMSAVGWD